MTDKPETKALMIRYETYRRIDRQEEALARFRAKIQEFKDRITKENAEAPSPIMQLARSVGTMAVPKTTIEFFVSALGLFSDDPIKREFARGQMTGYVMDRARSGKFGEQPFGDLPQEPEPTNDEDDFWDAFDDGDDFSDEAEFDDYDDGDDDNFEDEP